MADNRSEGPSNEQGAKLPVKESGRFGYTPIPSEFMGPPETPSGEDSRSSFSPTDVFGLVLLLGAVQEIWQLKSLFCYRGLWQDDRRRNILAESQTVRQAVVLTIATGSLFYILFLFLIDTTTVAKLRHEWKMYFHTFHRQIFLTLVFFISIRGIRCREFLTQFYGRLLPLGPRLPSSPNAMMANDLLRNATFKYRRISDTSHLLSRISARLPSKLFKSSNNSIQKRSDMAASVRTLSVFGTSMRNRTCAFVTSPKVVCLEILKHPLKLLLLANCSPSTPP